jgi:hypothetical protein
MRSDRRFRGWPLVHSLHLHYAAFLGNMNGTAEKSLARRIPIMALSVSNFMQCYRSDDCS